MAFASPTPRKYPRFRDNLGTPVGSLIPGLMRELGLDREVWQHQLMEAWTEIAGPQVARHARPGRLENGILHVFVSNGPWLSELKRFGHRDLLANLQRRFGSDRIRRLVLEPDPDLRP